MSKPRNKKFMSKFNKSKIKKISKEERINSNFNILKKVIGKGQSGIVKLIERKGDRKKFAVKIPVSKKELEISIIMDIEGIGPKVEDFFTKNNKTNMIMELLEGMELTNLIENTNIKINEKQADNLIRKIDKLHNLGFLHNDLGTINVFVKLKNMKIVDIILIDFGKTIPLSNPKIDFRNLLGTIKATAFGPKRKNMEILINKLKGKIK